jgi:hypothetical protein
MNRHALALAASLALGAAAGCGGSSDHHATTAGAAASGDGDALSPDALATAFEGLAEAVEASGDECDAFADLLGDWVRDNRARVEVMIDDLGERSKTMSRSELDRLDSRLTAAFEVIGTHARTCENDAEAAEAVRSFDRLIEGT